MKTLSIICMLIASFGGAPLTAPPAPLPSHSAPVEHLTLSSEGDPREVATCEDTCDVAEEWCAAGCEDVSAECPVGEEESAECISPRVMCEAGCQQELEACQARCDAP